MTLTSLKFKRTNIFWLCLLVLMGAIFLIKMTLHPVVINGSSMSPTYVDGELLCTKPVSDPLAYDSIVVFYDPSDGSRRMIKRVVGLPGDTLQIIDGVLYRNGTAIIDVYPHMDDFGCLAVEYKVSDGYVFVLGDNRNNSRDSRVFGEINQSLIFGKAIR